MGFFFQLIFSLNFNTFQKIKLTQKTFSSWYGLIIEKRLKIGKAKALFDWKLSYR